MKCPNCQHSSGETALLQCSQCGESFERGPLEEYQHLAYMARWLADRPEISHSQRQTLLDLVEKKRGTLRLQLLPKIIEEIKPEVKSSVIEKKMEPAPQPTPVIVPPAPEVKPAPIVETKPIVEKPAPAVMEAAVKSAPVPVPVSKSKLKVPPKPVTSPKPKRPPIDWQKVITEAVTSGALLRALLYLGAFMIVISATVLVVRFWNQFNPVLQLAFIASVPLLFYAGGWTLRTRLELLQAGTVLTGIGSILVAVDFGAIYQFGGLAGRVNGPVYWTVVAFFCTALYAFTTARLKGEFFDYLTLLSGASFVFALTRIFRLPIEWSIVSVTASAAAMTVIASRLWQAGDRWREFARASRYLPQILIPASVYYVMYSPAQPPIGQMMAFLFATLGYSVFAWQFPSIPFVYAALGGSIGTVVFGLRVFDLPMEWYATAASVLALIYIAIGQRVARSKIEVTILKNYIRPLNTTGLILIGIAALSGLFFAFTGQTWAGITGMALASLDLAICAYLFDKSIYTLLASGLFIIPFSVASLDRLNTVQLSVASRVSWLTFAWNTLALAYIGSATVLQKSGKHNRWLYVWAHGFTLAALFVLPFGYLSNVKQWVSGPALVSLGAAILVYLVSFILQDSGKHTTLLAISKWLPFSLGRSIFLWPLSFLVPVFSAVAWYGGSLPRAWLGTTLTGLGIVYIAVGQRLFKRAKEYRLPLHMFTYLLCTLGIMQALYSDYPLLTSLLIATIASVALAYIYNRMIETTLATLLFIWPLTLALDVFHVPSEARSLAYVLSGSILYVPIAVYLNKFQNNRAHHHTSPVFVVGYLLTVFAVVASIVWSMTATSIMWINTLVPLIATALYVFSVSYFKTYRISSGWAWTSTLTLAITYRQVLTLFKLPGQYDAFAWIGFAAFYMIVERSLFRIPQDRKIGIQRYWFDAFHLPMIFGTLITALIGLLLTLQSTMVAFQGKLLNIYFPPILAQATLVLLAIVSARLYKKNWTLYIEPFLSFLPVTLFFIGYGKRLFGGALTTAQYAFVWSGLGLVHFAAAVIADRAKIRYSHGLYLGGYSLLSWAVLWSMFERSVFVWAFGLWIFVSILSALLVHVGRHQAWDEFLHVLYGTSTGFIQTASRNAFQWFAAWTFPIWCVVFLRTIHVTVAFSLLGLVVPPLAYLGLALWFRRVDSSYAIPLQNAAHFYTLVGWIISLPITFDYLFAYNLPADGKTALLAFILLQAVAVIFYAASAWMSQARHFAHLSAWLSISAFSMAWQAYGIGITPMILVLPWLMWAAVLLTVGFALDKNKVRYSHGPYLAGYALIVYALARSTAIRLTNIYALAIVILLTLVSHVLVYFGRHHSFEDFINAYWKKADETTRRIVSTIFLFFAAYALPILFAQILAYNRYSLAWRGVGLAIIAPLYIAIGLALRNAKPRGPATVTTWPLYSAAYALTAIGTMVAFEDERMAITVLALDAVVYVVSAYIFRQSFWLYLSNGLAPVIVLLILHNNDQLKTNLVAWTFMAFAFVYLAIGQFFDRKQSAVSTDIHTFAAPFYAPGFLLSAIALALATNERPLAIQVFLVGVILYALSGWLFRETLFIYPAAWLVAVPYHLGITLTSLDVRWYGLAWLPLILLYITIGYVFFHKRPLAPLGKGMLVQWLTHPAVPFYLLAYGLSVSMISLSYVDPLAITLAFGITSILYFASAFLFRKPGWLYASLFTAHMTLLTYFTINPKGGEAYLLAYPFHALTWVMSLLGYGFSHWISESTLGLASKREVASESTLFKFNLIERLLGHAWARPFFVFAIADILIWQSIALYGYQTFITLAIGHALLLTLFSLLWVESALVYGVVGFGLLAVGAWMRHSGFEFANAMAVIGGIGFGLYLLARLLEPISARFKSLTVWLLPLTRSSIFLTALAVIVNLPFLGTQLVANAAVLAFAGALYVTIAYRGRQYVLGYLGMALLEVAWAIVLFIRDVNQPQLYAIPGGLYFLVVAYLELQRGQRKYAIGIEILGLGLLLVPSFVQSLNGAQGFPYFVLLLVEAFLVVWWGTIQKRKIPFFVGISASALNILAQVVILISVYDINRWLVAFGAGLIIMSIAIFIERSREQLRTRARELSEALEQWK